jgi:dTDP-6-deoxy-L-talose 4-dehydrogenase (NAD+)
MNILLTGSTGFIGKNVICSLLKENYNLCLINKNKKFKIKKKKRNKIVIINSDINFDKVVLKKIINFSPDILIHLAWENIPNYSEKNSLQNLLTQRKFFNKIFTIASIKKIIITGSCSEHKGQEYLTSKYFSTSKIKIKNFVRKKCLMKKVSFIWMRLFFVYGRFQNKRSLIPKIIYTLKKGKEFKIVNTSAKHDYINVLDVVNFIKAHLNFKYCNYECDLGSSHAYKISEIYDFIKKKIFNLKNIKSIKRYKKDCFVAKNFFFKKLLWKPTVSIEEGVCKLLR